jgi:transcription elongation factor Elf1
MPGDVTGSLPPEKVHRALAAISTWHAGPEKPVACPACGRDGLSVSDRSARPYAEWYVLSCAACGLDYTLHIPLSPPTGGSD